MSSSIDLLKIAYALHRFSVKTLLSWCQIRSDTTFFKYCKRIHCSKSHSSLQRVEFYMISSLTLTVLVQGQSFGFSTLRNVKGYKRIAVVTLRWWVYVQYIVYSNKVETKLKSVYKIWTRTNPLHQMASKIFISLILRVLYR